MSHQYPSVARFGTQYTDLADLIRYRVLTVWGEVVTLPTAGAGIAERALGVYVAVGGVPLTDEAQVFIQWSKDRGINWSEQECVDLIEWLRVGKAKLGAAYQPIARPTSTIYEFWLPYGESYQHGDGTVPALDTDFVGFTAGQKGQFPLTVAGDTTRFQLDLEAFEGKGAWVSTDGTEYWLSDQISSLISGSGKSFTFYCVCQAADLVAQQTLMSCAKLTSGTPFHQIYFPLTANNTPGTAVVRLTSQRRGDTGTIASTSVGPFLDLQPHFYFARYDGALGRGEVNGHGAGAGWVAQEVGTLTTPGFALGATRDRLTNKVRTGFKFSECGILDHAASDSEIAAKATALGEKYNLPAVTQHGNIWSPAVEGQSPAAHNAFTDVCFFGGVWYCCFREATGHGTAPLGADNNGNVRVLRSVDFSPPWTSVALFVRGAGEDLRDPKLVATPDGRLMCLCAAFTYNADASLETHQSRVFFTANGTEWDSGTNVGELNYWIWRARFHGGVGYGIEYATHGQSPLTRLSRSLDSGRTWTAYAPLFDADSPTEADIAWAEDETAHILMRRNDSLTSKAIWGTAVAPYTAWSWVDSSFSVDSPCLAKLADERIYAMGKRAPASRTSLLKMNPADGSFAEEMNWASSPSGDVSYPGMFLKDGVIHYTFYSNHEGPMSIYAGKLIPSPG